MSVTIRTTPVSELTRDEFYYRHVTLIRNGVRTSGQLTPPIFELRDTWNLSCRSIAYPGIPLTPDDVIEWVDRRGRTHTLVDVWRIEDRGGNGPYVNTWGEWQSEAHNEETGRPGPEDDGISWRADGCGDGYLFGFESLEKLEAWFTPGEIAALAKGGFSIRHYRVPDNCVVYGDRQCVFDRDAVAPTGPAPRTPALAVA